MPSDTPLLVQPDGTPVPSEALDGDGSSKNGSAPSQTSTTDQSSSNGQSQGGEKGSEQTEASGEKEQNQKKNGLEWVVFAIGVAITLGTIGYLSYQLVAGSSEPPRLVIELGEQTPRETVVEIEVEVRNEGDTVAQAAVVEVCGGPDTCAELTFPYVPAGSKRSGTVGLNTPLSGPLETRAVSFQAP